MDVEAICPAHWSIRLLQALIDHHHRSCTEAIQASAAVLARQEALPGSSSDSRGAGACPPDTSDPCWGSMGRRLPTLGTGEPNCKQINYPSIITRGRHSLINYHVDFLLNTLKTWQCVDFKPPETCSGPRGTKCCFCWFTP